MVSRMVPTVSGCIRDGVPPPRKMLDTVRPGVRAAVEAISVSNARRKRGSSMAAWRTWLLKSQYGHFDRQNGQCTYTPKVASAFGKTRLRKLEEGAGAMRQAAAMRRQAVLFFGRHLAEGLGLSVREKQWIVTEAQGAARRPHHRAVDCCLELLDMAVGPRHALRRDEMS